MTALQMLGALLNDHRLLQRPQLDYRPYVLGLMTADRVADQMLGALI